MKPGRLLLILFLIMILCLLWARYIEPERLVIRRVDIPSAKWPAAVGELRILQISDLHLPSMSAKLRNKVVQAAAAEKPDLIVITGDFFSQVDVLEPDRKADLDRELEGISAFLSRFQAPLGIWIVRGNHDMANDKEVGDRLVELLRRQDIHVLANQHGTLVKDGSPFELFGLDFIMEEEGGGIHSRLIRQQNEKFLRIGPSRKDTYTFYYPAVNEEAWRNYTFSARLRIEKVQNSGMGLVFYSQLHHGLDHYYRLRWSAVEGKFRFVPHNTVITHGQAELPVAMPADKWYRCKVQVSTEPHQTRMSGKVWPDGQAEPEEWQATAYDSSARRLGSGPVGLWSIYEGRHDFDDLLVVAQNGDTLLKEDWDGGLFPKKPPFWIDWGFNGQVLPLMAAAAPESGLRILLYHNPEFAEKAAAAGMDLLLAGHTHGGQIRLPLLGAVWLYKDLTMRYDAGLFHEGRMRLYVNEGLGTIYLPLRFLAPPEVTMISIKSRERR